MADGALGPGRTCSSRPSSSARVDGNVAKHACGRDATDARDERSPRRAAAAAASTCSCSLGEPRPTGHVDPNHVPMACIPPPFDPPVRRRFLPTTPRPSASFHSSCLADDDRRTSRVRFVRASPGVPLLVNSTLNSSQDRSVRIGSVRPREPFLGSHPTGPPSVLDARGRSANTTPKCGGKPRTQGPMPAEDVRGVASAAPVSDPTLVRAISVRGSKVGSCGVEEGRGQAKARVDDLATNVGATCIDRTFVADSEPLRRTKGGFEEVRDARRTL